MTYEQLLRRYLELSGPRAINPDLVSTSATATAGSTPRSSASRRCSTARWPACTRQTSGPIERITVDLDEADRVRGGRPAGRVVPRGRHAACCTRPTCTTSSRSAAVPASP